MSKRKKRLKPSEAELLGFKVRSKTKSWKR